MAISTVEEKEIPENYSIFTIVKHYPVAAAASTITVVAAGHHPKCRMVSGQVNPDIFTSTGSQFTIKDGDANAASDTLTTAVVDTVLDFTPVPGQVFERNEAIQIVYVQGNAANASTVVAMFESVH